MQVPPSMVCEFFGVFSRLEFALKESNFLRAGRNSRAAPNWDSFAEAHGQSLSDCNDPVLANAIQYLLLEPPQVQVVENDVIRWKVVALRGATDGARAIDAVLRVRNNLFHGGKHSPHSPAGRDEKLIKYALTVLYACIDLSDDLRFAYENSQF